MAEDAFLKIHGVAIKCRVNEAGSVQPREFPNIVPPSSRLYEFASREAWTSGFFAGFLWQWYAWSMTYPLLVPSTELLELAWEWTTPLHASARKKSYDVGFLTNNTFGAEYEFTRNIAALLVLIEAAQNLLERFSPTTGFTWSWDRQGPYQDPDQTFLVIIDNLMNLELLFHASRVSGRMYFANAASFHSQSTAEKQIREDGSHWPLIVCDTFSGKVLQRTTWQGYSDDSTWSRGQAWGIYGFAMAYHWTGISLFQETSMKMAEYFLSHLPADGVPAWNFNAPEPAEKDTSAATIAASGSIYLASSNIGYPPSRHYISRARDLVSTTLAYAHSALVPHSRKGGLQIIDLRHESILMHATPNLNDKPNQQVSDVGVVCADYYLVEALRRSASLDCD